MSKALSVLKIIDNKNILLYQGKSRNVLFYFHPSNLTFLYLWMHLGFFF